IADVDAGEDDLADARPADRRGLLDDVGNAGAAALAARLRDGAERALVVAAVLDLEEGARAVALRVGRMEGVGQVDLAGANARRGIGPVERVEVIEDPEFLGCAEDKINPFDRSDRFWFQLGI